MDNLDVIRERIEKLSDHIIRPFPDTRIWHPDETCRPFYMNNLIATATRGLMFHFSVSQNMLGVIRKVCYMTADNATFAPTFELKQAFRLRIVRGQKDATNDNSALISVSESIHGAVQDYDEGVSATQDEGFASSPMEHETCILLNPGFYWVQAIGNSRHFASLFGWVWPNQPRKP